MRRPFLEPNVFTVTAATVVFLFIGNYLFAPPIFDYRLSTILIKTLLAVLGMFVLPFLTIKFLFKKEPREFGLAWPTDLKKGLKLMALIIFANLPVLFWLSKNEEIQSHYRFYDGSFAMILSVFMSLAIYYLAEEFLFRGFLFLGLWQKIKYHAFWVNSVIFASAHFGKSNIEILYTVILAPVFCYQCLKSKTFLLPAATHFALAVILDLLVNFA